MLSSPNASVAPCADLRLLEFDLLRAAEMAALNCVAWHGKGNKEAADAAACDAIRGMFERTAMQGEIVIGEGIKDEAPGLFAGERVGTWEAGAPRLDIAIDPLDGTTNLSKGLPNSICCIAAALRAQDDTPVLQGVPAFYMKKLAYPPVVRQAWVDDPQLPLDINAPISEVIKLTARLVGKSVRDIVVMIIDRPRNAYLIDEVRSIGASLRMITDGDISAALAPALSNQGVDLYAGIGGAPEGILAAAGLRCLGGGMQAQMWPRDDAERQSLVECGWSDRVDKVYRSRDLVHGEDVLFVATGISDSPLLRGVRVQGAALVTHSVVMRKRTGSVRFIRTEHDLVKRPICLHSAIRRTAKSGSGPFFGQLAQHNQTTVSRKHGPDPFAAGLCSSPDSAKTTSTVHGRNEATVGQPRLRMDAAHVAATSRLTKKSVQRVPAFLLFGAPGSGKGTVGRALATLPGCTHCSSGDVIRATIAESNGKSPHALKVARGALLTATELFELFDDYLEAYRLRTLDDAAHLLIDGIPRCRSQIEPLDERVDVRGVFYLDCGDPKILVERLRRRFAATGRSDDADEAVVLERLRLFHTETLPLLDEYPQQLVHRIDAAQAPALVLRDILNEFEHPATRRETRELQGAC